MSTTPTNDGGPAFPKQGQHVNFGDGWLPAQDGMSLRDYFAAKAMQGILATFSDPQSRISAMQDKAGPKDIAEVAYSLADALLAARNQTTK